MTSKSFYELHPELMHLVSPRSEVRPEDVTRSTNKRILFVCGYGHEWLARPLDIIRGSRCGVCSGKVFRSGVNDLKTKEPAVAALISPNSPLQAHQVQPKSNKHAVWVCENEGHEYSAKIANVVLGSRCPYCTGQKVLRGFNDLASKYPFLAREVSAQSELGAAQVTAYSNRKLLWECPVGHKYEQTPVGRVKRGRGCPRCQNIISRAEAELADYVRSLGFKVVANSRSIITPRELDIYVPSVNKAIEYNGRYWHQDATREAEKMQMCQDKGIDLMVVWDDDDENDIKPRVARFLKG